MSTLSWAIGWGLLPKILLNSQMHKYCHTPVQCPVTPCHPTLHSHWTIPFNSSTPYWPTLQKKVHFVQRSKEPTGLAPTLLSPNWLNPPSPKEIPKPLIKGGGGGEGEAYIKLNGPLNGWVHFSGYVFNHVKIWTYEMAMPGELFIRLWYSFQASIGGLRGYFPSARNTVSKSVGSMTWITRSLPTAIGWL